MADTSDNLTTETQVDQISQQSDFTQEQQEASNEQETEKVDLGQTSSSPNGEASNKEESEYQIKCPEFIPQEEVEAHKKAFRETGIDAKTAQAVVDKLVE